ncbi:DotA/TraY family protein [Neokomagataea thailandica]|nr:MULTISPECIES: DotA/TraY family protein [Neokomagataea]
MSWSNLDPGDDWSWTVLQRIFPISGGETVTGTMLKWISVYVLMLAGLWISYASYLQIHKTAENGKIFSAKFNGWVPIRLIFALILMLPVYNGFSCGQQLVLTTAKLSIGMARNLSSVVMKSVGPSALPISEPTIPGTQRVVTQIVVNEYCRALLNAASHNPALVPVPTLHTVPNTITLPYTLAVGQQGPYPVCGVITQKRLTATMTLQQGTNDSSVKQNWASISKDQSDALLAVVADIRKEVEPIAQKNWNNKSSNDLLSLDSVITSETNTYTVAMTNAASKAVAMVRSHKTINLQGFNALGWTGLGAYYLEIARLNSEVFSIAENFPDVSGPSWTSLGDLAGDVAPYRHALDAYAEQSLTRVSTTDSAYAPNGPNAVYSDGNLSSSGVAKTLRKVGLSEHLLTAILNHIVAPGSGQDWADPLGGLIGLGHFLIHTALLSGVLAIALSSKTLALANAAGGILTFDPAEIVSAIVQLLASTIIKSLLTPILLALSMILIPGIFLAYVIPMAPYVYWVAGVAGWFIIVVEAVVVVPVWALAHMIFEGDGLHGKALRGYELLFTIFFRPVMMIAGLILSYTVFSAISWFLMKSFSIAAGFVFARGDLLDNLIGIMVMLVMFVGLETAAAMLSFRLINTLPHHLPAMLGMSSIGRVDADAMAHDTVGRGAGHSTENIAQIAQSGMPSPENNSNKSGNKPTKPEKNGIDSTTKATMRVAKPK